MVKKITQKEILNKTAKGRKRKAKNNSEILVEVVIKGMQEKKAEEIIKIDFKKINNSICDYFIICHGNSGTHANSISDSIEFEVRKKINTKPWHKEGMANAEWILLDYIDVVVHIFQYEARNFYRLENLWGDAEITKIEQN